MTQEVSLSCVYSTLELVFYILRIILLRFVCVHASMYTYVCVHVRVYVQKAFDTLELEF